jgi:hypothetical protein
LTTYSTRCCSPPWSGSAYKKWLCNWDLGEDTYQPCDEVQVRYWRRCLCYQLLLDRLLTRGLPNKQLLHSCGRPPCIPKVVTLALLKWGFVPLLLVRSVAIAVVAGRIFIFGSFFHFSYLIILD